MGQIKLYSVHKLLVQVIYRFKELAVTFRRLCSNRVHSLFKQGDFYCSSMQRGYQFWSLDSVYYPVPQCHVKTGKI